MFRANDTRQITVYDSFLNLPAHIQRLIEKSWAKDFSDVIFPAINEERFSVVIYRCRGDEAESRLERTIREAAELKQALETAELNSYGEYELLSRALREQTNEGADGVRTPKDKREASAQQETLIADGAYGGTENVRLAEESGVELVATALTGKNPDEVMGEFQLSEDGSKVLRCPMGYEPVKRSYHPKNGMCRAKFSRSCCENCPYRNKCRAREQKKSFVVNVSAKMVDRANTLKKLSTPRYRHLARLRNGIECRPSLLRRRLDVDNIPVFGYSASKCFFTGKIGASNFIAFFSYRKRQRMECAIFA